MLWRYFAAAILALLVLLPVWVTLGMVVVEPNALMTENQTMTSRIMWWIAVPVLVVAAFFGWRWHVGQGEARQSASSSGHPPSHPAAATAALPSAEVERTEVLEVVGLGVTFEKYRQGQLWEALQNGGAVSSIREQDPKKYPWSADDKAGQAATRVAHAVDNGLRGTPMYWGIPVFNASGPISDPTMADRPDAPQIGIADAVDVVGMGWHLLVAGPRRFEERPDRLLEDVFEFFDNHRDVPFVVLTSNDGLEPRDLHRAPGTPALLRNGHYVPETPDTDVVLVLARRDRVNALRQWAFEDVDEASASVEELNRRGVARRLYLAYDAFQRAGRGEGGGRRPTVDEWLKVSTDFVRNSGVYSEGVSPWTKLGEPDAGSPNRSFKPTPWFPVPWNKDQLASFDRLPTLGYVHRPVFVKTVDENGQALSRSDARAAVLASGWQRALQSLPESDRLKAPSRIVSATGGNTDQTVALHHVLNDWSDQGGPELDPGKVGQWLNVDRKLGDTGAATLFAQISIGIMGSYRAGGTSVAINMRDDKETSIVFITPPGEEQRRKQQHRRGGDVFKNAATPTVDPSNYEQH
ncbi:type VI lipase adapter Tla3 domain-containing protein [Eleftheria terrae]|uniref:type VI lipase adapter Tla3 domain-containing protein n=1 Tax=Eleftheria terrae TaxID=1597781 RepID=UPI00263BA68B|nr:DUF2875 family protein [Eleftheria terrae]WKB50824.1 DUF2875 family protein [Eleftheria terrae]